MNKENKISNLLTFTKEMFICLNEKVKNDEKEHLKMFYFLIRGQLKYSLLSVKINRVKNNV